MSSTEPAELRPFSAWLCEQRQGALHAELSETLQELVAACEEHGKPGEMTLKVKVKPSDDGVTMFVGDDVTAKLPVADRPAALYFADEHHNLTRSDPRQLSFDQGLREVRRRDDLLPGESEPEVGGGGS
jgi:hypothetical protein